MAALPPVTNTLVLLLSAAAITWAHWALGAGRRRGFLAGLASALVLGLGFFALQTIAAVDAPFAFAAAAPGEWRPFASGPADGVIRVLAFMWTGYHGYLVVVGVASLAIGLAYACAGGFKAGKSGVLEGVAWYWHATDLLWLFVFAGYVLLAAGRS